MLAVDRWVQQEVWTGLRDGRRTVGAHIFAYEQFIGKVPEGMQVDHECCVPACVRPSHLAAVTARENDRRKTRQPPGGKR